jgi:arabinogalactan oligomer / maltooligosaccharide transport system permease protein
MLVLRISRISHQPGLTRGPLAIILTWNFAFAFLSVFLSFALGLAISILYGDPNFPGKKILRSLLIIPYTIPSLITILIWRGILNENIGIVKYVLRNLINFAPAWTTNQWWAKAAVLIVNLWLGYPYFMLVTSGALQSIPSDIYEAAEVDGARGGISSGTSPCLCCWLQLVRY